MAKEHLLLKLPDSSEDAIAALATLQSYAVVMQDCKREFEFSFLPHQHEWLIRLLDIPFTEQENVEYDLVFDFDVKRAYDFAKRDNFHICLAFSVLIGTVPQELPTIPQAPGNGILIVDFPKAKELATRLSDLDAVEVVPIWLGLEPQDIWNKFSQCRMVVSYRSAVTYLAAASGKKVFELYTNDVHRGWLSKFHALRYHMVYGDNNVLQDVDLLERGARVLWNRSEIKSIATAP